MVTTVVGQKCIILDKNQKKCLVLQRSDYGQDSGKRDMIGGAVQFGEDLSVAIRREAMEEAGIVLDTIRPLDVHARLFSEEKFFVFILRVCEDRHFADDTLQLSDEHNVADRISGDLLEQLPLRDTVAYVLPTIRTYLASL